MQNYMRGKRVVVTGTGTGIGQGIARGFSQAGAAVAVHYSHSAAGAKALVRDIRASGGKAKTFQADFTQVEQVRAFTGKAVRFLGGVDVLVNSAGITMNRLIEKTTVEQFDLLYAVNVRAPYVLCQTLVTELAASRGAIVNVSSIHAYEGYTEHSVYAGTRGAMVSFTRQLAVELAPRGIRVVRYCTGKRAGRKPV